MIRLHLTAEGVKDTFDLPLPAVPAEVDKAYAWFKKAGVETGQIQIAGKTSPVYNLGQYITRTNVGNAEDARYQLAKLILSDTQSKPEEILQAVDWLTKLAEAGSAYAQYALGKLYRDGGPVKPDAVQAVIWFSQAAEQGHEYAMYAMGKMDLEVGNAPAALRWFQMAAEQGNQFAQYALGKLYLLGRDVLQDKDAAVRWFTLAAEQGNEYAQYYLDHINNPRWISPLTSATRLLHHMSKIFRDETPPPSGGVSFVDSKLRRKIREKKIAMGHKPDDHEDQPVMSY